MMPPGLSVFIDDGHTRRMVTGYTEGLRFTKVAPGGHQSLSCQVTLPHETFPNLGPNDLISVTDQRTGRVVFDGYLKNPTPVTGLSGEFYSISALGGMWRASDESRALIYADQSVGNLAVDPFAVAAASLETGTFPSDETAGRARLNFPTGSLAATGDFAAVEYTGLVRAGMTLGAIAVYTESGKVDTDWMVSLVHPGGTLDVTTMTTTGVGVNWFADDDFPDPTDYFAVRLRRTGGATNVADDATWTDLGFGLVGQRVDRHGVTLSGAAAYSGPSTVLASEVAEDLLGRLLTMCDPWGSVIDPTTFAIDQLAYPDGTKAAQVLTDLGTWEPDHTWEILERLPSGMHRFGYRQWPTLPRYIFSAVDGWERSGSDADVCNRVLVTWDDAAGVRQALTVTASDLLTDGDVTADEIDDAGTGLEPGRIRDAEAVSLPAGTGSVVNAARIGRSVLLESIRPPVAGTVRVRRPVLDLLSGCWVRPWEIEPGYVGRVQEKGLDLRITQVDYDHPQQEMTVTLGTPVLTIEQRTVRADAA